MIILQNTLISEDIIEEQFVCDLGACKGQCCVEGESGAPLTQKETKKLEMVYEKVKPFLTDAGKKAIAKQGTSVIDFDNEFTTPLVKGKECAYVIFQDGISKCGIEKAFEEGKIDFKKPISCHLYPIRISDMGDYEVLNYHAWTICKAACTNGKKLRVPVYRFLKDAIVRKFGLAFYEELDDIAEARP